MSTSRDSCCLPSVKKQKHDFQVFAFVQCIIKQSLDSIFVISRIIKVSVRVISLSLRLRLITLTSTLIILDITKTSSNNCLISFAPNKVCRFSPIIMSLIEYRNLLFEVSENIAWITESRRLLFICKVFLPDGCENDIQDVLSLLIKLEEENKLGIDSLEVLKDLLDGMGKWNLLQRVEKFENKRIEYKSLLEQCGRVLDECNQLERLISVCEGKISHDRREHITDVSTLFMELEKQNNLGIKRLEILKTMATVMEKPDLIEQVGEFEKKRKQEEDAERKQNELEEARRRSQGEESTIFISNIKMYIINGFEIF